MYLFKKLVEKIGFARKSDSENAFIIAIEGTDRSGKETQSKLLKNNLEALGLRVLLYSFPQYDNSSSRFVKNYLNGDYGKLDEVNPYQASTTYAIDRLHTYLKEIKPRMNDYDVIIFDRYVGSNLIHQTAKISSSIDYLEEHSQIGFVKYWSDFEFEKLGLPEPDITILLDMPIEMGKKIAAGRNNKNGQTNDIHETNDDFMNRSYEIAHKVANYYDWLILPCVKVNKLTKKMKVYSISKIAEYVLKASVMKYIQRNGKKLTDIDIDLILLPVWTIKGE